MISTTEELEVQVINNTDVYYHVTVLSNFFLGYDKYSRTYSKTGIPNSSYPGIFFLLDRSNLHVGIDKASKLLDRLNLTNNKLIVIETKTGDAQIKANDVTDTKLGEYIEQNWINVLNIYYWTDEKLNNIRIEDAVALSYQLNLPDNNAFESLRPRSASLLPVASGCQAKCPFCFSTASISTEQKQSKLDIEHIHSYLSNAKHQGAERAVITGGGEPGLLKTQHLLDLISVCKSYFDKVVLITNGYSIAKGHDPVKELSRLCTAGLSVLSISRHHFDREKNAQLMGLDIDSEAIAIAANQLVPQIHNLNLRWICVLQKGGIDSKGALKQYLDWSFQNKVSQICFKELYVSSSSESLYYEKQANDWSYMNQVPLSMLLDYAREQEWEQIDQLPWGSPIYKVSKGAESIIVAAYTEPSVSWELANKQCRSWNLMADGRCYASLESKDSEINLDEPI